MRYPEEPHRLIGGVPVHEGAISMLIDLLTSGHTVTLDEDGRLVVDPLDDLHETRGSVSTRSKKTS